MITDLMLYGTKVALLIGVAALALERVAAWRGFPRRGIWAAALVLSLAVPTLSLLMPGQATAPRAFAIDPSPSLLARPGSPREFRALEPARPGAIPSQPRPHRLAWPARSSLEHLLVKVWLWASAALVTFYVLVALRLRTAARCWRRARVNDQAVWVTEALGPAVYGLMQPVILLPQWVLDAPSRTRALILAHEQEHIDARDPALVLLGLVLVVIAPWNLLLWWQLRRLRFAVEVDCDARVLRRGEEATVYGEVLLAVGERRTGTPLGAVAMMEPASQLLQRIRIMTAALPKRGKWAIASAVGLSLASLALAAQLQAPILPAVSRAGMGFAELRKPPPGEDPRLAHVQHLVRATYPELFSASAPSTPVLVTLLMSEDGTFYKSFKEDIAPRPWITTSLYALDAMGVGCEHLGRGVRLRLPGGSGAQNPIDVHAWYLKAPVDPARSVATVCTQVKARYASLFEPTYADGSRVIREGSNLLTVFMTEAGEIDRANVEPSKGVEPQTLAIAEHFVALGIARERVGLIGTTEVDAGHFADGRDLKTLRVIYVWPRRADEPVGEHEPPEQPAAAGANDDPAVNRAIAEHYFPDLYTYPKEWPRADPWVLLDRQGTVLKTGRRVVMSGRDIQLYVESLYPGIRTDEVQVTAVQGNQGRSADIGFVWLAADSPITDLSKIDLSERNAVLLSADVIGEGMTRPTGLSALKVGSPALLVSSLKNPFGVVHVEVMPEEIATDAVTVRVRVQHAPLPATAEIPKAVQTAWPADSAPVRAPYGGSTDVEVTDQNGNAWKIVLHPERLGAAAS
jgi:BlaR1 peptidase M56